VGRISDDCHGGPNRNQCEPGPERLGLVLAPDSECVDWFAVPRPPGGQHEADLATSASGRGDRAVDHPDAADALELFGPVTEAHGRPAREHDRPNRPVGQRPVRDARLCFLARIAPDGVILAAITAKRFRRVLEP
jgi:hypothetical protein